jgi:hypothetical protein
MGRVVDYYVRTGVEEVPASQFSVTEETQPQITAIALVDVNAGDSVV